MSKIDEMGKLAWIPVMVLSFWLWWPVGLAVLMFLIFSGRFRAMRRGAGGRWYNMEGETGDRFSSPWGCGGRGRHQGRPSGNRAFDEYRTETLRRLEEEQKEFQEYLEKLRQARDKAEFDQFMNDRRNRGDVGPTTAQV